MKKYKVECLLLTTHNKTPFGWNLKVTTTKETYIYVPPENSNYSNISIFDDIEDNFIDLKSQNEDFDICIAGDLNAITANLKDYLEVSDHENEYLCNEMSLNSCDIQQSRNNVDVKETDRNSIDL